jgi:hypothetical protein
MKMKNPNQLTIPGVAAYENKPVDKKQSPIIYILEQQKLRVKQDLYKLRIAIDSAENVKNPNRELLHNIYREIIKDLELSSNWESRKMKVKQKTFKVGPPSGDENEDLTKILQQQWFFDWIDACLDTEMWDFSLIEFGPLDTSTGTFLPYKVNGKYYDPITVVDRDNVKPELGIITNTPGMIEGVSFDDPKIADYLMFVGSHNKMNGILWKAAKYILFKDNALGNWSEWAEVFGMDKRIGYTNAQGDDRKRFIDAIKNIGANAYGVFGERDKVEYLGTERTDAFGVYEHLIQYIDGKVAKIVFGQDVVTNNTGRVVGEVGENISNMYGDSDSLRIKNLVNGRLFPLMARLGFTQFQGQEFDWDTTEKLTLVERSEVDERISRMGKTHSDKYINNTYGTDVTQQEDPASPEKVNEKLRSQYGSD